MKKIILLIIVLATPLFLMLPSCASEERIKTTKSISAGKILYEKHCMGCHGQKGEGYKTLYPPIQNSDYLQANKKKIPCIIKKGMHEPIKVNGKEYKGQMLGFENFDNNQISYLMNYLYNMYENTDTAFYSPDFVKECLQTCE